MAGNLIYGLPYLITTVLRVQRGILSLAQELN